MKTKTAISKITSLLLAFALVLGFVPTMALTASAATAEIKSGLPTIAISTTATPNPTVIGFGGKEWVVIGYAGTGVNSQADTMTLLLANGSSYPPLVKFDNNGTSNVYNNSTIHTAMNTAAGTLSTEEKALIVPVDLAGNSANGGGNIIDDKMAGAAVNAQLFWPLSVTEANAIHANERMFTDLWWLRSAGSRADHAATVDLTGFLPSVGGRVSSIFGVRPALKINLTSVIFSSSAASGGKPTGVGANLEAALPPTAALKLTVLDTNATNLDLSIADTTARTAVQGETIVIPYSGAVVAANKYVSCVIENSTGIQYYAKLATAANGTANIEIPTDMPVGNYTIKLFNEQCNADNYTDYASTPIDIALTVQYAPVIISSQPANATIIEGSNASFSVTATGSTPITYQWEESGDNGTSWNPIAGETSATLALTSVPIASNGKQYRCVVNNPVNTPVTSAPATLTVNVTPTTPTVTPANLSMQAGSTGSFAVAMGTGTDKADSVSIVSDNLAFATVDPASLNANGNVTVTGVAEGTANIKLTWTGGSLNGTTTAVAVTVTAVPPTGTAPTITTTALPNGQVGVAYSQTLTATGTAPIVWTIDSGSLPAGLTINSAGVISGTPTAAEPSSFTVKAANGVAPDTTKALKIVIDAAGTLPVAPTVTINTHPAAETTVTEGSISGSLSISATASDGSALAYQWFNSPANTAVAGATSASFPIPTGLAAGSYSYYCVASSGSVTVKTNVAKVVVAPPVVATTTPAVTSINPINLDLNGSATGFVTVTLGASGVSGDVLAGQADITVSGSAVTATPAVLTADGNVTITAQSVGTATISIAFSGNDVTDTSYNRSITVNVTDSTKTTSGGGSSSSGGTNKADVRPIVGGTTTGTNRPVTTAEATKLFDTALAAKAEGATTLSIKVQNATSVTKEVLAELAASAKKNGVTLTVHFDTVVGGRVTSRISVNPALVTTNLDLTITVNKALAARFTKFYSNPLAVFTVKTGGSVAIPLPANLKPEGLVIYSYDAATNTFAVIPNAKPWVDKNGYLHFELPAGTQVVISQGKLVKK